MSGWLSLLDGAAVTVFGSVLSASFCDGANTGKKRWIFAGCTAAILLWQGTDESGIALLKMGDVITTIWKMASYSGDDDFEMYAAEELTVPADTAFGETPLFDGNYAMVFSRKPLYNGGSHNERMAEP